MLGEDERLKESCWNVRCIGKVGARAFAEGNV